jgi:endonuclease/exonuclease/phosphatase (EEP) superfamily protein YafD
MIEHAVTLAGMLAALTTLAWGKRYKLPEEDDVFQQINAPLAECLDPEQINVLVWNMHKGLKQAWTDDFMRLSTSKDILLLQEIQLDDNMGRTLFEGTEYAYHLAFSFKDTWDNNTISGVATASKVSPVSSTYLRSFHREPVIRTHKMVMFAEYPISGTDESLLTANIHAVNFVSNAKHRRMMCDLESELEKHHGPIILAGDFNTWNKVKIRSLRNMVSRLGLEEVAFENDHRTRVFGNALDWVFSRGLSVSDARVHGTVIGSDHKPMEVVFSYSGV